MLLITSVSLALAQAAAPIPTIEDAATQVAAQDAALFWAAFEGCEPEKLSDLLTEDFRMIHDLGGEIAANRSAFVEEFAEQCANREPGGSAEGYKNRRLLVPGSRTVTPLGEWGVLERGMHTFHEWRGDEIGWLQVGGARYIHVWKWMPEEARFRLNESISIDHGAAEPYPPTGG